MDKDKDKDKDKIQMNDHAEIVIGEAFELQLRSLKTLGELIHLREQRRLVSAEERKDHLAEQAVIARNINDLERLLYSVQRILELWYSEG